MLARSVAQPLRHRRDRKALKTGFGEYGLGRVEHRFEAVDGPVLLGLPGQGARVHGLIHARNDPLDLEKIQV